LIDVAISSSQHGYMKPHPSIFEAALKLAGVEAAESVMVGDSLSQDIEGARRVGMRGVLVRRSETGSAATENGGVPVIGSLRELPDLL
jgi:FMN phosphatase YigB (HAD superfamily)